jgi:hypothetical protein
MTKQPDDATGRGVVRRGDGGRGVDPQPDCADRREAGLMPGCPVTVQRGVMPWNKWGLFPLI